MDTNSPKNKKPIITRPLTETQQMESILNINDISDIVTPESNEEEQRKIRKLEMDLQEAQKDVEVREKQIENLKKTQKHLESHQELQKKKIESLQKKIDALENETAKMRESQISEIVDTAPLEAKIKELEIECQKLRQENSRLKKDFDSKDVSVVEKSREVDKYKIKIEELTKKIEDSEAKFNKKIKELQSKASVPQLKPKPEVVVDSRELEILKLANQKLTTQLAEAKSNAYIQKQHRFSLKKQLEKHIAESEKAEKNAKSIENDLAEANKAKEFLKRKVRQLQETLKNKESSVSTDPDAQKSSKFNLEQELEDEDDEVSGCSPEDKEIKKILKSIFEAKNIWNRYPRTRVLNSIIVNAENLLEEDSDDDDY